MYFAISSLKAVRKLRSDSYSIEMFHKYRRNLISDSAIRLSPELSSLLGSRRLIVAKYWLDGSLRLD